MWKSVSVLVIVFAASLADAASPARLQQQALALDALGFAQTPSVIADPARQRFVLSWQARLQDGCAALRVATLSMQGELGEVHEVARGCDWFLNWADYPQLAIADNGDWLTYWLQKEGSSTYAYGIRVVRSTDEGATWSAPITPHDDGSLSEHGFVSMAPAGDDRMLMIWLDGRHAAEVAGGHHGGESAMSLRSAVLDRAGNVQAAEEIDHRVCSCCGTDLLRTADNEHLALFRDRSEYEIRDIGLARRDAKGWHHQGLVHADNWMIRACPVNGPGLAQAGAERVAAWSTMPNDREMAVRLRRLGETPGAITVEQGPAVLGRVDLATLDGAWLMSWLGAGAPRESVLRYALFDAELQELQRVDAAILPAGRGVGVPRLAALPNTAMLVWTASDPVAPRQTRLHGLRLNSVE